MAIHRDLQESRELWDQIGPEGATHYAPRSRQWYKNVGGEWHHFNTFKNEWQGCGLSYPAITVRKPEA